jgi:4a-hydroxytetrahydrobiopterin dehydratase
VVGATAAATDTACALHFAGEIWSTFEMEYTPVAPAELARMEGLGDWRFVLGAIHAEFALDSFPAGAALVSEIATAAEAAVHHPDVSLRYPGVVRVILTTHAAGGVTTLDVDLARTVSRLAATAGAEPRPRVSQAVELAIDTMDADRIRPFWIAVLGYRDAGRGDLVDPARVGPPVWFQQMDEPRTERNRFHVDISVPHDVADSRVEAALAAGGRLVSDARARAFWVLADADGNEACICTWQDRSTEP